MRRGHFERHMYQWSSSLPPHSSMGKRKTATFKDIWAPYDSFSCSITTQEQTSWFSSCCILEGDSDAVSMEIRGLLPGIQESENVTEELFNSFCCSIALEPRSRLPDSLPGLGDWGIPGSQESENVTFQPVNFDLDLRKSSVEFVSHVRNKELGGHRSSCTEHPQSTRKLWKEIFTIEQNPFWIKTWNT